MASPYDAIIADLDDFLRAKESPLAGYGQAFVQAGQKYGVDPNLLVAISGAETNYGTYGPAQQIHNAWGWGPHIPFSSWEEGIDTVARGLAKGYIAEGRTTIPDIAAKWAPAGAANDPTNLNSNWTRNVTAAYQALTGAAQPTSAPPATTPMMPSAAPTIASGGQPSALPALSQPSLDPVLANIFNANNALLGLPPLNLPALPKLTDTIAPGMPVTTPTAPTSNPFAMDFTTATAKPEPAATPENVTLAKTADRPGVSIHPEVVGFVGDIASIYGQPLTITTGTSHNQYVKNTHRESAHWTGWAADIPASGADLTRLGYSALLAAGMDPKQATAAAKRGGLFNVGGVQIIFNASGPNVGGNHWNHLHVGFRPERQRA